LLLVSLRGKVNSFEQDAFVLVASSELADGVSVLVARTQYDVIELLFKAKHIKPQAAAVHAAEGSGIHQLSQKLNDAIMRVGFGWNCIPISAVTDELPLCCFVSASEEGGLGGITVRPFHSNHQYK